MKCTLLYYTVYVLFIGSTRERSSHRATSMPPEILDAVHDIHTYMDFRPLKNLCCLWLRPLVSASKVLYSISYPAPTYGFESDRVRRAFVRHFVFGGLGGGGGGIVGGGTKDGSTPWGGGSARLHILWPKNNHLTEIYWLHWRAVYKSAVHVVH
jgi:hypothetical protein